MDAPHRREGAVVRLLGYCTSCRRFVYVLVSGHALALATARGGVPEGICSACEEDERKSRRPV